MLVMALDEHLLSPLTTLKTRKVYTNCKLECILFPTWVCVERKDIYKVDIFHSFDKWTTLQHSLWEFDAPCYTYITLHSE